MMKWIFLLLSIAFEIGGTTLLKLSDGNKKWYFTILSIVSYSICFWVFGYAIKYFEIGKAYAIWAGIGIVATTIIGVVFFKDSITFPKVICFILIGIGTIGLNILKD